MRDDAFTQTRRFRFQGSVYSAQLSESLPIAILETRDFKNWIRSLRDRKARSIINRRLFRVRRGTFGTERSFRDGLWELKIDYGPGYRVYFGRYGDHVVVLVAGSDKDDQNDVIRRATASWREISDGGIEQL